MVEHLRDFAPKHCEQMGDDGLRRIVALGMDRAAEHGFTNRGPVRYYIELILMFGCDFPRDSLLPWAGTNMDEMAGEDQSTRAERVYADVCQYLEEVAGPDNTLASQALSKIAEQRLRDFHRVDLDFELRVIAELEAVYPEKCRHAGSEALRVMIRRAKAEAQSWSVDTDAGRGVFIWLMFLFGCGFAADPQFPWVSEILTDPSITDIDKRTELLWSKALAYLDHFLPGRLEA